MARDDRDGWFDGTEDLNDCYATKPYLFEESSVLDLEPDFNPYEVVEVEWTDSDEGPMELQCLECHKRFMATIDEEVECPRCGGSNWEPV